MKLITQTPKKSLNKAFLKQRPQRSDIDLFKKNLIQLLEKIDIVEREENQKNHISNFLRDTYYKDKNEINTKENIDLVIHTGNSNKDNVGVIIETKRPSNKSEMLSVDKINTKAFQELVLYYLIERIENKNNDIKYCVATNIYEWYIFEASYFEKLFYRNKGFVQKYNDWKEGKLVTKDTYLFYNDIAKPFIDSIEDEIPCTYFDIREYERIIKNADPEDDKNLIALYKILSPVHLLKVSFADDSNKLNENFYKELLYIIGLEEVKEGSKHIIRRKEPGNRNSGSLIENAISILETEYSINKVSDSDRFGNTKDEQYFNTALELCITWINRILFLKLLEAQLVNYHNGNVDYRFLNSKSLNDYDELYRLFHQVLAIVEKERIDKIRNKYINVPYLNSSLFEINELEDQTIKINSLDNSATLELINTTILKDVKKKTNKLPALEYLFQFLDAYDFASEGKEDILDDNKTLINSSVLGKVYEKINGYKDGSIYTPGFITMYMCRQSIRLAVVKKFKDKYNWNVEKFDDLKNYIADRKSSDEILEFNELINSLRICDPAVGSGHYLVSSLNEIIAIKWELGIFADEYGRRITDYEIVVENDELIITDKHGDIFEYKLLNGKPVIRESQRLQRTLFHEKQTIIENCLFGVDINQNSVKICRLRLWIELLKNAYYKEETDYKELETLPNIDINIKCGNSLLSRFPLNIDLQTSKKVKEIIEQYKRCVKEYKNEKIRENKTNIEEIITSVKKEIQKMFASVEPKLLSRIKLERELFNIQNQSNLFEQNINSDKEQKTKQLNIEREIKKLNKEIKIIESNLIYANSFEWRFEFPEILNKDGEFEGFDLVIGNPPYGAEIPNREVLKSLFPSTSKGQIDTYKYFIELAIRIIKFNGYVSYITSDSYLEKKYFKDVRNLLICNSKKLRNIKLGDNIFDNINLPTAIFQLQKGNELKFYEYKDVSIFQNNVSKEINLNDKDQFQTELPDIVKTFIPKTSLINTNKCKKLIEIYDQVMGVKVYQIGKGKPKQTSFEIENNTFISVSKESKSYYPFISQGIERYSYNSKGEYISYGDWLAEPRKLRYFTNPKVIIREIVNPRIFATYIEDDAIVKNIAAVIISKDKNFSLKYLLALLNSRLFTYYLFEQSPKRSNKSYPSFSSELIKNIPIKEISFEDQQPFIDLVEKILELKKLKMDITKLDEKIDNLVYKLYELTEEEIKIVEGEN